jgi:hypothetical protein
VRRRMKMGSNQFEDGDVNAVKDINRVSKKIAIRRFGRTAGALLALGVSVALAGGAYEMSKDIVSESFNGGETLAQAGESLRLYSGSEPAVALTEAKQVLEQVGEKNPAYATRFNEMDTYLDSIITGGIADDTESIYKPVFGDIAKRMGYLAETNDTNIILNIAVGGSYAIGALGALYSAGLFLDGEEIKKLKAYRAGLEKLANPK